MIELETSSQSSKEDAAEKKKPQNDSRQQPFRKHTLPKYTRTVLNPKHEISYKEVNQILRKSYQLDDTDDSVALDILALYLKGQKIIYTESKTFCEQRLHALMLPAILIAALCSILNFILKEHPYGVIIISSMNAFNSFLLSVISYLKLDAKAESHKMAAHKFQKLESMCEFNSGKTLIFKDSVDVYDFVDKIENQVMDIRESNQFIIPENVRMRYPQISAMNVFTIVKQIGNDEIILVNRLKDTVQKLHEAIQLETQLLEECEKTRTQLMELDKSNEEKERTEEEDSFYQYLLGELDSIKIKIENNKQDIICIDNYKTEAFEEVVKHRVKYLTLSETYTDEIMEQNQAKRFECSPYNWCKT